MTTPRQLAVLRHVGRYGVSLRAVIERQLFPDGESSESALRSLVRDKLLVSVPNAVPEPVEPGTAYGYYHVTRKATAMIGAPESKGRSPGSQALRKRLSILWLCSMGPSRGHLLTDGELSQIFPLKTSEGELEAISGNHGLFEGKFSLQVHNLYISQADNRETLNELRKRVAVARRSAELAKAIHSKQYVFTILVETGTRQDELRALLSEHCKGEGFVFNVTVSPGSWRMPPKNK